MEKFFRKASHWLPSTRMLTILMLGLAIGLWAMFWQAGVNYAECHATAGLHAMMLEQENLELRQQCAHLQRQNAWLRQMAKTSNLLVYEAD